MLRVCYLDSCDWNVLLMPSFRVSSVLNGIVTVSIRVLGGYSNAEMKGVKKRAKKCTVWRSSWSIYEWKSGL